MKYYKCNDCENVFDEYDASIQSENITDNYYEDYDVCPYCHSHVLTELSKEQYEEELENQEYDKLPAYINRIPIMDALAKEQGKAILEHRKDYALGLVYAQQLIMMAEGRI